MIIKLAISTYTPPEIKPSHKGLLHENLGIAQDKPIPTSKLEAAKHSSDPAVRRRATFALNSRNWNHHGK